MYSKHQTLFNILLALVVVQSLFLNWFTILDTPSLFEIIRTGHAITLKTILAFILDVPFPIFIIVLFVRALRNLNGR